MFLIKGINKSGDWESQLMECRDIPEALSKAQEKYNVIHSIRYYASKEEYEGAEAAQTVNS